MQGPKFVPSLHHSLVLYPSGLKWDNAIPVPKANEELDLSKPKSDSGSKSDTKSDSDDSDALDVSGN